MKVEQRIVVQAFSPVDFMKACQEVILRGAKFNESTYPTLSQSAFSNEFSAEFLVEVDVETEWKDKGPVIQAYPAPLIYTKEQLEELEWDTFKRVLLRSDVKGRDRVVMTTKYLQVTGQAA